MATLYPSPDYTRTAADQALDPPNFTATTPLVLNQLQSILSIMPASATTSGIVTAGAQSFAGAKTFVSVPSCATQGTAPEHLVNKGQLDDLIAMGIHWLTPVIAFHDFASGDPPGASPGDRYIASTTDGAITKDYIYTNVDPTNWSEYIPTEGDAVYVSDALSPSFPEQCILFNDAGAWVSIGSSINHQSLIGAGTLTHSTIDARLGQAVNASSTPSFAGVIVTGATPSTSTITGAITCVGGLGIGGATYIGGLARVTDTTVSTSSSTGCATVAGGLGIGGALFAAGAIRTNDTTASTSVSTGSLIADGGIGCAGAAYINTLRITDTTSSTDYTTGCATFAGGIGCAGDSYYTGRLYAARLGGFPQLYIQNDPTESMQMYVGYDSSIGKACIYYNSAQVDPEIRIGTGVTSSVYPTRVRFPNTTASTSATTGAVVFDGGVGIQGALFVGSNIRTTSTTTSSSVSTGALISDGGLGVAGNAYIGGLARVTDTTASSSTNTGCATFAGGVGIAGALNVGGAFSCAGFSFTGPLVISDTTTSTSTTTGCARFAGGIGVAENAYINTLRVTSTTEADGTTGCATFGGGVSVAAKGYFGGQLFAQRLGSYAQLEVKNGAAGATLLKFHVGSPVYSTAGQACIYLTSDVTRNLFIGSHMDGSALSMHTVTFANTAASTSATTGAVVFAGGIGVSGAIYTGSDIIAGAHLYSSSVDDTTGMGVGSLQVYGGAYVQKRLIVDSGDQATSTSTGAIRTSGGLAVTKNAYIGGDLYAAGTITTNAAVITGSAGWSADNAITPTDTGVYRIYQLNKTITIQFVSSLGYTLPGSGTYGTLTLVDSSGAQIVIPSAQRPSEDVYVPVMITTDVVGYIHFVGYVMVQQSSGKVFLMRPEWDAWVASSQVNTHPINISYPIA